MNQKSKTETSLHPFNAFAIVFAAAFLVIAAFFMNKQQSKLQTQLDALTARNSALQDQLDQAQAQIEDFKTGDSTQETKDRMAARRANPVKKPAEAEIETLFLQEPTVEQIDGGLLVHLQFDVGTDVELPDQITLVVRIPPSGTARIQSLNAADTESGIGSIVNDSGSLGMIQCSPAKVNPLTFDLIVTQPVKALVRGSEGIIDFEIDITPDGCTVRKM